MPFRHKRVVTYMVWVVRLLSTNSLVGADLTALRASGCAGRIPGMSGPVDPRPEVIVKELSVGADGRIVIVLDGRLTCTACGYESAQFIVDFSDPGSRGAPVDESGGHDPGE